MLAVIMPAAAQTRQHDSDSLLRAVRERDQKLRMDVMNYYAKGQVDSVMLAAEQLEQTDVENQRIVFGLLDAGGWPEGLSDEANSAIFLVIDHAEVEAQKRYYRDVVKAARRGYIGRSSQVTLRETVYSCTRTNARNTVRRPYRSAAVTLRHVMYGQWRGRRVWIAAAAV